MPGRLLSAEESKVNHRNQRNRNVIRGSRHTNNYQNDVGTDMIEIF